MHLGFIGLGSMGLMIARRISACGHQLTVFNRTASKAASLAGEGVEIASSVDDLGDCDVIFSVLADDNAVRSTLLDEGKLRVPQPDGGIHVSMATISPDLAKELDAAHSKAGRHFVSAPVLGRPNKAAEGKLIVLVAGHGPAVEHVMPLLDSVAERVVALGLEPSMANTAKLGVNFLVASAVESLSESFAFVRKGGVDAERFLEIVTTTIFACPLYGVYAPMVAHEECDDAAFSTRLGLKDVRLMLDAAESIEAPLPIANVLQTRLIEAIAQGYGDRDWAALACLAARLANLPDPRGENAEGQP